MEICQKHLTPHIPPFKVTKVTGTDKDSSATYDFLLVIHSNHGPLSYRFQDKWRKLQIFSTPMYLRSGVALAMRHRQ